MKVLPFFIILSFFTTPCFTQKDICSNIYIWDFSTQDNEKNQITKILTNEVEEVLTETSCKVLQRREYAKLASHAENENAIQNLEQVPVTLMNELQLIKAERVLFGVVDQDFSGNLFIRVSFENLLTKEVLLSKSLVLANNEAYDVAKRKEKIRAFIIACVGPKIITLEEDSYWKNVLFLNTVEAYEEYLQKYPNGKYRTAATNVILDEMEWEKIQKEVNKKKKAQKVNEYLRRSSPRHEKEAKNFLGAILYQEKEYEEYALNHPNGDYIEIVEEIIWSRRNEIIKTKNRNGKKVRSSRGGLVYYIKYFPDGKYLTEENLWNAQYYKDYFRRYPNGKYVTEDNLWTMGYTQMYLDRFPQGKFANEDDILAKGGLQFYLKRYPKGKYATEDYIWSKGGLNLYLNYFPSGKYITEDNLWARGSLDLYLNYFPNGRYFTEEYIWTKVNGDVNQYFKYFPGGKYAENEIWSRGNLDEYLSYYPNGSYFTDDKIWYLKDNHQYLEYFPNGKHSREAKRQIEDQLWARVESSSNNTSTRSPFEALAKEYLRSYPSGRYNQKLDDIAWNRTVMIANEYTSSRDPFLVEVYLKLFPNGKYSNSAKK